MSAMTHLQARIKELREANCLNQSQLAAELGVSRGSISFYENGDRVPDAEFLYNAARYFHVSADWLLGLSDVKSPDCDLQQACSYTGLSEYAIEKIRELDTVQGITGQEILSAIIEDDDFGTAISYIFMALDMKHKREDLSRRIADNSDSAEDKPFIFYHTTNRMPTDSPDSSSLGPELEGYTVLPYHEALRYYTDVACQSLKATIERFLAGKTRRDLRGHMTLRFAPNAVIVVKEAADHAQEE